MKRSWLGILLWVLGLAVIGGSYLVATHFFTAHVREKVSKEHTQTMVDLARKATAECRRYRGEDLLTKKLPCTLYGNACIIEKSMGGCVADFDNMVPILSTKYVMVINGHCASACAYLASALQEGRICVTANPEAALGFHQESTFTDTPNGPVWTDIGSAEYGNQKVRGWIKAHGGEPKHDRFLVMPNNEARKIWPTCTVDKGGSVKFIS